MNAGYYEKIEDYLNGEMSQEEKLHFEAALSSDEELLTAFKVYRTIETDMRILERYSGERNALKNTLQSLDKDFFKEEESQSEAKIIPLYSSNFFKIAASIAASIAIILVAYFGFLQPKQDIQLLADNYFEENLQQLNQTWSTPEDTLQFGIATNTGKKKNTVQDSLRVGIITYNNQDYQKALGYFQGVYHHHPENNDAKKFTGLVYLSTKEYDKALQEFEELANKKELQNNPGLFLQAVTLMRRNNQGDKQKAKVLLQKVVDNNAEGSIEAKEWLKKF